MIQPFFLLFFFDFKVLYVLYLVNDSFGVCCRFDRTVYKKQGIEHLVFIYGGMPSFQFVARNENSSEYIFAL